ncbi:MAG: hypothetical protein JWN40_516 [Phycisphaerales bacterium]|nr:hypothetical protein [Phycisphaerales bacterium]
MNGKRVLWSVLLMCAITFVGGCGKSDSEKSGGSSGGGSVSGKEREAQDAAMAEVAKHCTKGADGWTTARDAGTSFAPVQYLRQYRDLSVEGVQAAELSDADRLNGFEWAGEVSFKKGPCREAGESGVVLDGTASVTVMRRRGAWSQWIDYQPEALRVQRVKGQWQVNPDNPLLTGKAPTPGDFARAGVR